MCSICSLFFLVQLYLRSYIGAFSVSSGHPLISIGGQVFITLDASTQLHNVRNRDVTCFPITSMLARRKCLLADLLLSASSRNDATPVATALRSRLFASVCTWDWCKVGIENHNHVDSEEVVGRMAPGGIAGSGLDARKFALRFLNFFTASRPIPSPPSILCATLEKPAHTH